MIFKCPIRYTPFEFKDFSSDNFKAEYALPSKIAVMSRMDLREDKDYKVHSLENVYKKINIPVSIGITGSVKDPQAYYFYSRSGWDNLGTGLSIIHKSWHSNVKKIDLQDGEFKLIAKLPDLYVYHAPNKLTLITSHGLNESFHDYLTMI